MRTQVGTSQFFCKSKTDLQNKVCFLKRNGLLCLLFQVTSHSESTLGVSNPSSPSYMLYPSCGEDKECEFQVDSDWMEGDRL